MRRTKKPTSLDMMGTPQPQGASRTVKASAVVLPDREPIVEKSPMRKKPGPKPQPSLKLHLVVREAMISLVWLSYLSRLKVLRHPKGRRSQTSRTPEKALRDAAKILAACCDSYVDDVRHHEVKDAEANTWRMLARMVERAVLVAPPNNAEAVSLLEAWYGPEVRSWPQVNGRDLDSVDGCPVDGNRELIAALVAKLTQRSRDDVRKKLKGGLDYRRRPTTFDELKGGVELPAAPQPYKFPFKSRHSREREYCLMAMEALLLPGAWIRNVSDVLGGLVKDAPPVPLMTAESFSEMEDMLLKGQIGPLKKS
jgi:hypothetical protein